MAWLVVQTEPLRESTVNIHLADAGFDPYLPRTRLTTGRVVPLFAGYLFVAAVPTWWRIKTTVGVRSLLMAAAQPALVPDDVIAEIRGRERGGLVPSPAIRKPGARLTVLHGPFRDCLAIYQASVGHERERVMLQLFGRMVQMDLPARDLR